MKRSKSGELHDHQRVLLQNRDLKVHSVRLGAKVAALIEALIVCNRHELANGAFLANQ